MKIYVRTYVTCMYACTVCMYVCTHVLYVHVLVYIQYVRTYLFVCTCTYTFAFSVLPVAALFDMFTDLRFVV